MWLSLFGAALGFGLCSALRARYRTWKAARPNVVLTKDRHGVYRDPLDLLEKRLFLGAGVLAVVIVIAAEVILFPHH